MRVHMCACMCVISRVRLEVRGQRSVVRSLLSHVGPRDEALIIRLSVKKPEITSLLTGPGLSAFLSHACLFPESSYALITLWILPNVGFSCPKPPFLSSMSAPCIILNVPMNDLELEIIGIISLLFIYLSLPCAWNR